MPANIQLRLWCAIVLATSAPLVTFIPGRAQATSRYQKLAWSDEFNSGRIPDTQKWNFDIGGGGWGNNELETYTKSNARIRNGNLIIEGRYNPATHTYTSARLTTKGKGAWQYGRIEVRAKLPTGVGSWPAIWTLPQGAKYGSRYLANGEMDIMEEVGADQNEVVSSAHSLRYNPANHNVRYATKVVSASHPSFHTYGLDWTPEYLSYSVDGVEFYRVKNDHSGYRSWPYDQPYYLILNLAAGGSWGGYKGVDTATMPWQFVIDYVRVYQ